MSHQGVLSTKQQEAAFLKILKKPYNLKCADCSSKSPTWASLDFGVFVCYNCSGQHRALGQNITRVRSTRLDCWSQENLDMMDALGNDLNDYWENRLPKNAKLQPTATPEEIRNYVQEKYIKKSWVKQGQADPKTRYTQCLMSGVPFRVNQTNTFFSENGTQNQALKDQMKQFHSTQQIERKERQFSIDSKQKEINLLSPDKGGQFDWSSFNHFNTVSGIPPKQLENSQKQPQQSTANQPSPTFKPKQNNLQDFDLLNFCHQQQNTQQKTNQQQNQQQNQVPIQFYSHNPPSSNQFNSIQPQSSWAQIQQKQQNTQQNNTQQQSNQQQNTQQSQQQQQTQQLQQQAFQQPQQMQQTTQQQSFQYQTQTYQNNQTQYTTSQQVNQFQAPTQQPQQYQQFQTVNQGKQQQNGNDLFGFSSQQCWTSKPPLPTKPNNNNNQPWSTTTQTQQFTSQKYQNNPFAKDCQDILNLYNTQQPNKYEQLRNNPFM